MKHDLIRQKKERKNIKKNYRPANQKNVCLQRSNHIGVNYRYKKRTTIVVPNSKRVIFYSATVAESAVQAVESAVHAVESALQAVESHFAESAQHATESLQHLLSLLWLALPAQATNIAATAAIANTFFIVLEN